MASKTTEKQLFIIEAHSENQAAYSLCELKTFGGAVRRAKKVLGEVLPTAHCFGAYRFDPSKREWFRFVGTKTHGQMVAIIGQDGGITVWDRAI